MKAFKQFDYFQNYREGGDPKWLLFIIVGGLLALIAVLSKISTLP